ncbi:uncharacterized protein LOC142504410 [Primulina tabacum]|uniref:uncharacterized protein LOC142504410 n=1 Tax=Primulina tabacum TaxID=48773 RepID=UPI003F591496
MPWRHRKTINPEDLLYAMETTKFHNYAETLTQFLRRQREEHLARDFMRDRPLIWPNVIDSVQAQDQVLAQQVVDPGPQDGLTGSSSGPSMDAGVEFPLEEFDVYQPFK